MNVLLETDHTVLVDIDGKLEILPNNDYTQLRMIRFGGGRIEHDFGDGCVIRETYNRGIYNCECDGELIQVYDGGQLARAILDNNVDTYRSVFSEWYSERLQSEVVDSALAAFRERVVRTGDMYVIDDVWGVNTNGGAMYKSGGSFRSLCLVADRTEDRDIVLPGHHKAVRVNARTWVVIAKILFLLAPRPEPVFMGQLPQNLKGMVRAAHAG